MEKREVNVNIQLDLKDIEYFNFRFMYSKFWSILYIVILAFMIVELIVMLIYNIEIPKYFLIAAVIILAANIISLISIKYYSKNLFKTNEAFKKPFNFKITNDGIEFRQQNAYQKLDWSNVYKIKEYKKDFEFFVSKYQAYIIPKRFLNDEDIKFIKNIIKYKKN